MFDSKQEDRLCTSVYGDAVSQFKKSISKKNRSNFVDLYNFVNFRADSAYFEKSSCTMYVVQEDRFGLLICSYIIAMWVLFGILILL